jgi:hypothetical protein
VHEHSLVQEILSGIASIDDNIAIGDDIAYNDDIDYSDDIDENYFPNIFVLFFYRSSILHLSEQCEKG